MKTIGKPLLAIIIFLVMQFIGGLFAVAATSFFGISSSNSLALGLILSELITVSILFALKMIRSKTFNPARVKWKLTPMAFAAALLGIFATNLLSEQLNLPDLMKAQMGDMAKSAFGILAIAIIGPIVEELVFREAIIHNMLKNGAHRWQAILFSALAFGLIHFNPSQVPFAIIMGVILAVIYVKTNNIVLTSIIHIFNNSIAVIELNVLGEHSDEFSYSDILGGTAITWFYIIACAALSYGFLVSFWKKYHRHGSAS